MPIFTYVFVMAVVIAAVPGPWIWGIVAASFTLLVATQLLPPGLLVQIDLGPGLVLSQFLLISAAATIRLGFDRWRQKSTNR